MNLEQGVQPKSSVKGLGCRRADREMGANYAAKMHSAKSTSSSSGHSANGGKVGVATTPSRDRLIYVLSYLLGLPVEVHVRNGSVISGIFHATNPENDLDVVLKMAEVIKDSLRGQKSVQDIVKKPTDMIIQARDLVQIIAKDLPLNIEEFSNGHVGDIQKDLIIDSAISHSYHVEVERELEPWAPDADDPEFSELEDIFDGSWNRNWDQFETNEALFGVKSTFDEELYTTKLERGPQMTELEREATRMAREIEGEDTCDLHLAEERGIQLDEDFDLDEEIKYSAVQREIDDHTFGERENSCLDAYSTASFISSVGSAIPRSYSDITRTKFTNEDAPSTSPSAAPEKAQTSQSEVEVHSSADVKGPSSIVTVDSSSTSQENIHSTTESSEVVTSADGEFMTPSSRPGTSTSSTSEHTAAGSFSRGPSLSPSSSLGSLNSEKSTLHPSAKEFKLNPNAKSFTPSGSFRPPVPTPDNSFYYPSTNLSGVPPMRGIPVGIGYGEIMVGQSRPVNYTPAYPPDIAYRGRNF